MAEIPPIALRIILETGQVAPAAAGVEQSLTGIGTAAKTTSAETAAMGGSLKSLGAAFKAFAALEAVKFIVDSGKAAIEDNKSFAELSRTLTEATGASQAQIDATEKQIQGLATMSGVLDDQIRPSFDVLVRSTHDSTQALALQKIALDVSAGTGRELSAVTLAVAKAYEGNTTALNKLVPSVKGAADPLAALQKQFAGAAKTAADQDPYKRLQQTFDEMKETLGKALMPVFQTVAKVLKDLSPVITVLGKVFGTLADAVAPLIEKVVNALLPVFTKIEGTFGKLITKLIPPLANLFDKVLLPAISFVVDLIDRYVLPIFDRLATAMGDVLPGVINLFVAAFQGIGYVLKPLWDGVIKPIIDGLMWLMGVDVSKTTGGATSPDAVERRQANMESGFGYVPKGGGGGGGASQAKTDLATAKQILAQTRTAVKEAQNTYTKAVYDAYSAYNSQVAQITQQRNEALATLEKEHANKLLSIQQDYSNRLQGIVQQSMDLLRNAFKSAASIDVGAMFAQNLSASGLSGVVATQMKNGIQTAVSYWGSPSAGSGVMGLIGSLSDKLNASKKLVENSAALSGAGFSQNFIQQIVSQGSDMGNKMADAILAATPEQQKELSRLFEANQQLAATGMDELAKTIYDKTGLATDELKKLYQATQVEMTKALADEQQAYVDQQRQINETFTKGLADAHTTLVKSLNAAGDALNTSLDKIAADMKTKLSKVKGVLGSVSGQVASTTALIGGSYVTTTTPTVPGGFATAVSQGAAGTAGQNVTNNYYVQTDIATDADPTAYTMGVVNAIKFGNPIAVSV